MVLKVMKCTIMVLINNVISVLFSYNYQIYTIVDSSVYLSYSINL